MSEYIIYGKRINYMDKDGKIITDKTFRALDSNGVRVFKKNDAMSYASKEDAQKVLDKPSIQENIKKGLIKFDIRRG